MLALANGSRVNELLQVSWRRERRVTRVETVVLLGEDGRPQIGADAQPLTKQVKLHFQHLLPKGAKTDEERQLFPLSREAMRLLGEIKTLLEETHGAIPTVAPSRTNTKREHLKPEQYLFQWHASPDGQVGALSAGDVGILVRFLLHGVDLSLSSCTRQLRLSWPLSTWERPGALPGLVVPSDGPGTNECGTLLANLVCETSRTA